MKTFVIACGVLIPEFEMAAKKLGLTLKADFLPGGLHNQPYELKRRLQEAVDQAAEDPECGRIAIGYGICGRGAVNIKAPRVPLVFPGVHDCIALFLGGNAAYQKEFTSYPGTYYVSPGWYREKVQPRQRREKRGWVGNKEVTEKELAEKHGAENARMIIDFLGSWRRNYQRAAYIDTGSGNVKKYASYAKSLADEFGWKYQRLQGNLGLIERLLTADTSRDDILVVPPGSRTIFDFKNNGLAAASIHDAVSTEETAIRTLRFGGESTDIPRIPAINTGLGIDAGGTYTDAVIYDFKNREVIQKGKALTTRWDFTKGIADALAHIDQKWLSEIELVSVSTTLATNAIVEGEGRAVGLILMPGPGAFSGTDISHEPKAVIRGRMDICGKEVEPLNPDQIRRTIEKMIREHGISAFAVSGMAGAINPAHELAVKNIIQKEFNCHVTCGHELSGQLNYLVRAQTAVLNARIIPRLVKFIIELKTVLRDLNITAPVMVVKGDGTMMSAAMAESRPVETILSGPAASVAGARHLTGAADAVVIDMGGTTTDIAALKDDRVEVSREGARVGGFQTHVHALKIRTSGLGGDSLIHWREGEFTVGPRRVAPVSWMLKRFPESGRAIDAMDALSEARPGHRFSMQFLAKTGPDQVTAADFQSGPEEKLYAFLSERPRTLEEIVREIQIPAWRFLPLKNLEETGWVQRCGLTPTDLLNAVGRISLWEPVASRRLCRILSRICRKPETEMTNHILDIVQRRMSVAILKKLLDPLSPLEEVDESPVGRILIDQWFNNDVDDPFDVQFTSSRPLIGIGAPISYFLPNAAKHLSAEVIIPEHADVANAVGAVTSHVFVEKALNIQADAVGTFRIEGLPDTRPFPSLTDAESWAVDQLKDQVRMLARTAGTSQDQITMTIEDHLAHASDGAPLFLGRTITAHLSGAPDLGRMS